MIIPAIAPAAARVVEKTFIDYYKDCGSSGHVLALSLILFLGILFAASRHPRNFSRLLLPGSFFPLVAGIYGTTSHLTPLLYPASGIAASYYEHTVMECMYPVIAGSFLSMLFLLLTLIVLFATSNARGNPGADG
jgi:hypothetical protein